MVGKLVGKYQIISEVAQGRLGPIYRAQIDGLPSDATHEVILKTINFSLFTKSLQVQLKARFRREVYALRQLQHRNIVSVYELLNMGNDYFLVLENFQGATLRDLLMRQGVPNGVEALSYGRQMLAALDYTHRVNYLDESDFERTGIVHGDVRLSNLLLDQRGRIKVSDFSIIHKVIGGELRKLYPELIAYQSPEMQRGSAPDFRSDIFAAGAAFYEMLTGRLPSAALANEDWRFAKPQSTDTDAEALLSIRGDIPPALATAIARAVRRNPHDRYTTMGDFLKAVQAVEAQIAESEGGVRAKGNTGALSELPERPATFPYLLPQNADTARPAHMMHKPVATLADQRKPSFTARIPESALPGDASFDVAPPVMRRKGDRWLIPAVAASVLVGTLTGAYFFSSPRSTEGLASDTRAVASPVVEASPHASPVNAAALAAEAKVAPLYALPAATVESPKLALARASEQQERYSEAIKAYEEYAAANPNTAAANNIPARIEALRQFQTHVSNAKAAYAESRFDDARAQFNEALKLRPNSRMVQTGIKESGARIATPLTVPAISAPMEKNASEGTKETVTPPASNNANAPAASEAPRAKPESAPATPKPVTKAVGVTGSVHGGGRATKPTGSAMKATPKSTVPRPVTNTPKLAKPATPKPSVKPANKPSPKVATVLSGKP